MAEAKEQQAAAAEETTEEAGLLDQIVSEGRFGKEAPAVERGKDMVKQFVSEVLEGTITMAPDTESMLNARIAQIDHLDHEWIEVALDGEPIQWVETDGSGNYSATFTDVPRGGNGEVRYRTEIAYADVTLHRHFRSPDLWLLVDYDHDWVGGEYEGGHTVYLISDNDFSEARPTRLSIFRYSAR